MGSHGGCTGGSCGGSGMMKMLSAAGFPGLQKVLNIEMRVEPTFSVGVNQIELAGHGSQDYKFLPENKATKHQFIDIQAATYRRFFYSATAKLNPNAGESTTEFKALDDDQDGFFPSNWMLNLFLRFEFDIPALLPFGRRKLTLFNKKPFEYHSQVPLTGFPPLNGPDFILKDEVELFDINKPDEPSIFTFEKSSIIRPVNRIIYNITSSEPEIDPDGRFNFTVHISSLIPKKTVPTLIALMPTRGVVIEGELIIQKNINEEETSIEVKGTITDSDEEHIEVTIRPFSKDPGVLGFGRHDVALPEPVKNLPFGIRHMNPISVKSGEAVRLSPNGFYKNHNAKESVEHIWVAPHGITLIDEKSLTPSFTAPVVNELTDIWFTLYMRDKSTLSRPYKLEVRIEP